ncbi:MAG: glycosyltransferase family 39 protein [Candidatus Woesearchaeota archaeon]
MNFANFFSRHRNILIIILLALVLHLVFLPGFHELWWDSGVYVGMGKYIFSAGQSGLWEHIRPPILPFMLGSLWFLGLDILFFGELLQLLLSLGAIFIFYQIVQHYFDEKTATISAILFAFSSIFFYLSFHLYSEVPTIFFILLSIYLFAIRRLYLAGFFMAIACLTKFPAGIFIVVLGIALFLNKDIKGILKLVIGFIIPMLPVLILYQVFYGNALLPFLEARRTILNVLGCNVLRYKPWWHYFQMIFVENYLHIFALLGLAVYFANFKKSRLLPLLALFVPLIYFSQMHCRDYRYLTVFIPFVCLFSGLGISWLARKSSKLYDIILVLVIGISVFNCALFFIGNEVTSYDDASIGYFKYLQGKIVRGEVWSANPVISFFTDAKINKIYYPIYDTGVSKTFNTYLIESIGNIEYVFLDNCGGGIICPPGDLECEKETNFTIKFLETTFEKVYDAKKEKCWYVIFRNYKST